MNPELPIMAPKNEIPGISAEYPIPHLQERQKQPDTPLLGWIGFGSMGWAMSGRLLDAGMNLTGYNRDSTKVPVNKRLKVAKTPGDVSRDARILFMMLTDGHATHSVLSGETGILSRLSPGTIVVNMSTISPKEAEKEAQIVEDAGGIYLDIPVSGSVVPAQNGQLLLLAGGAGERTCRTCPHPLHSWKGNASSWRRRRRNDGKTDHQYPSCRTDGILGPDGFSWGRSGVLKGEDSRPCLQKPFILRFLSVKKGEPHQKGLSQSLFCRSDGEGSRPRTKRVFGAFHLLNLCNRASRSLPKSSGAGIR